MFSNLLTKIKTHWLVISLVIVFIIVACFFWFKNGNGQEEILVIKPADFIKTVAVSGKVVSAQSVDLGFNRSGKITQIPVVVGQKVVAGQLLASIDSREAYLALEDAKIDLKKIAESALVGSSGLSKNAEDSQNKLNQIFLDLPAVINGLDDTFNNYQLSPYLANLPNDTVKAYYDKARDNYYKALADYKSVLVAYRSASQPMTEASVKSLTERTYLMLQKLTQATKDASLYINFLYDYYYKSGGTVVDSNVSRDKANISLWLETVNDDLTVIISSRDSLKNSSLDIEAQKLVVAQKEYDYNNCFIYAPFTGVVTRLDGEVGEQAVASQADISMISAGALQIESFVPEVNIANLAVGNLAEVTLDAYDLTMVFSAKIISIDPAETIRDGVSTYKIKLEFLTDNPQIKPGMTANLLITSLKKPNTIAVPSAAITIRDGKKFVRVDVDGQSQEKEIITGEVGALGLTEVVSGLVAGDRVILNAQAK